MNCVVDGRSFCRSEWRKHWKCKVDYKILKNKNKKEKKKKKKERGRRRRRKEEEEEEEIKTCIPSNPVALDCKPYRGTIFAYSTQAASSGIG